MSAVLPVITLALVLVVVSIGLIVQTRSTRRREATLAQQIEAALAVAASWEAIAKDWERNYHEMSAVQKQWEKIALSTQKEFAAFVDAANKPAFEKSLPSDEPRRIS